MKDNLEKTKNVTKKVKKEKTAIIVSLAVKIRSPVKFCRVVKFCNPWEIAK